MQKILFTPSINDLQEKENQLQCSDHIDPKKNCIRGSWSFSVFPPADIIKWRRVEKLISIGHVDQQYNL